MKSTFDVMRRAIALAASVVVGLVSAMSAPSAAGAESVEAVVVRFRDDAIPREVTALPPGHVLELAKALRVGVVDHGRTRNGAFRLALQPPLPFLEARDGINRVRLRDDILYASLAPDREPSTLPRVQPKSGAPEPLLHRLIVKYRDPGLEQAASLNLPLGPAQLDRIGTLAGQPVAHERVMSGDAYVVRLFNRITREEAEAIADALAQDASVQWAQPDYLDQIALAPNDPSYASQWHYHEPVGGVNLPAAWNRTTGSASIRVAVIDTGSLPNHPDLAGKFVGGYDMIASYPIPANDGNGRDADPSDPGDWVAANECGGGTSARTSSWHGTHVAGTIAALTNNGVGVAGVNWASPIVPVRVLGKCGGYSSDIADGITWASGGSVPNAPVNATPAHVLNLSLGGYRSNATCDAVYDYAISGALSRNVVVVIAAGNAIQEAKYHTPGNCNGVITVAATGRSGQRASYSNYDDDDGSGTQVEIAAPGGSDGSGVLSTLNSGTTSPDPSGYNYVNYNGTSMATPHVAGIVSLMLSVAPTKTPSQILSAIQTTARAFPTGTGRDCTSDLDFVTTAVKYCGAGIIDASAAIGAVSSLPTTTTTLASSTNPSTYGQPVTFTASVTGNAPTGSVAFTVDGAAIGGCSAVALAGGGNTRPAQCTTSALAPGARAIVATYSGDLANAGSASTPLSQAVGKVVSTTGLASSANPSTFGATVTFTATVAGASPTGTVTFTATSLEGGAALCIASLAGGTNVRTAQCSTNALPAGSMDIVAIYGGDVNNAGSSVSVRQTVNKAATTTTLSSSTNPSAPGATVVFTASVIGIQPTGTVAFTSDGTTIPGCAAVAVGGMGNAVAAQCTASSLGAGSHAITAAYSGDASNAASSSPVLTQSVLAGGARPKRRDFNGDRRGDLLWKSAAGQAIWLMNGLSATSMANIGTPPDLVVSHVADFDGGGRDDLLFRSTATGATSMSLMNGVAPAASATLLADPAWEVTATGDFDGDGQADLVWRNASTGTTSMWLMNGLVPTALPTLLVHPQWRVTHVADFSGDGKSDLLWANPATGEYAIWLMNGAAYGSGTIVLANPAWHAVLTGDFNGDGRADIVWRNDSTGESAIWLMNGLVRSASAIVLANASWKPTHAADLDGDGRSDLVWRNDSSGATHGWLMNGLAMTATADISTAGSRVVTTGDFDDDGRADLVWYNPSTGDNTIRLMNGLATAASATVFRSNYWMLVP